MGYTIALIGIALCVLLCGIGSCIGLYKTSTAAAGVLSEDPKKFGKVMVLVLLPATQGIYGFIIGIIAPNNEPTNHVLRDIAIYKDELEKWGRKIVLVFRNQSEADRFKLSDFPELPNNIVFGVDSEGQIAAEMPGTLPVIKIADTFNRVVFTSEGYTIGIGETLMKAIHKL